MAPTPACLCSQRAHEQRIACHERAYCYKNVSKYLLTQNKSAERLNGQDKVQPRTNVSPTEFLRSELLAAGTVLLVSVAT